MPTIDLPGCPRCGRNHAELEHHVLLHPPHRFNSWAWCPVVDQPIFLAEKAE